MAKWRDSDTTKQTTRKLPAVLACYADRHPFTIKTNLYYCVLTRIDYSIFQRTLASTIHEMCDYRNDPGMPDHFVHRGFLWGRPGNKRNTDCISERVKFPVDKVVRHPEGKRELCFFKNSPD